MPCEQVTIYENQVQAGYLKKIMGRDFTEIYKKFMDEFTLKRDEPMKDHTSFKVGGNADLFASASSVESVRQLVLRAQEYKIPVMVIGSGTNILVRDNGIRGLVICFSGVKNEIKVYRKDGEKIIVAVSAGTLLSSLGRFAFKEGLEGLNFTAGIPGTVGGAVMMNSSASYTLGQGRISDVLSSVELLLSMGKKKIIGKSDIVFASSGLLLQTYNGENDYKPIIIRACFELKKGDGKRLSEEWNELLKKRNAGQPVSLPSAGCFFKNPGPGISAGELIDMAGLKGERCGNAMVSEIHANFIVNLGEARAKDILRLKTRVEKKVFDLFSIRLETEVKIEGE